MLFIPSWLVFIFVIYNIGGLLSVALSPASVRSLGMLFQTKDLAEDQTNTAASLSGLLLSGWLLSIWSGKPTPEPGAGGGK